MPEKKSNRGKGIALQQKWFCLVKQEEGGKNFVRDSSRNEGLCVSWGTYKVFAEEAKKYIMEDIEWSLKKMN